MNEVHISQLEEKFANISLFTILNSKQPTNKNYKKEPNILLRFNKIVWLD
jgi:hypothetical protein